MDEPNAKLINLYADGRKRIGRPRLHPTGTRRPQLAFRLRTGVYERLKAEADAHNRSMSEQVEVIVARHFDVDVIREMIREEMRRVPVMSGGE